MLLPWNVAAVDSGESTASSATFGHVRLFPGKCVFLPGAKTPTVTYHSEPHRPFPSETSESAMLGVGDT